MNRVLEVDDLAVFRAQTSAQTAVEHISLRSVRLTCRPTPAHTDEVTYLASHAPSAHPVPVWRARANTKTRRLRARLRISYPIYTSALTHPAMTGGRRNQAPSARARSPAPPLLRPLPTATRQHSPFGPPSRRDGKQPLQPPLQPGGSSSADHCLFPPLRAFQPQTAQPIAPPGSALVAPLGGQSLTAQLPGSPGLLSAESDELQVPDDSSMSPVSPLLVDLAECHVTFQFPVRYLPAVVEEHLQKKSGPNDMEDMMALLKPMRMILLPCSKELESLYPILVLFRFFSILSV